MATERAIDLIHVGPGKTATTTLQLGLFARHPGIDYLGKPFPDPAFKTSLDALIKHDDLWYEAGSLRDIVGEKKVDDPRRTVMSEERLTGFHTVGHGIVARRLHRLFPEAKVLFTIRNQRDALMSRYASTGRLLLRVPEPYADRHVTSENWLKHAERSYPGGVFAFLDYWKIIDFYGSLFGKDQIEVLLFEEFVDDKRAFVTKLAKILELDADECYGYVADEHHNRRYQERLMRYQVLRQRFLPGASLQRILPEGSRARSTFSRFLKTGDAVSTQLTPEWERKVDRLYAEPNARLAAEYGLPLERYGYPSVGTL